MQIEITQQQQDDYLNNPYKCPVCHSSELITEDYTGTFTQVTRRIFCDDCGHKWLEVYQLTHISDLEK